MIRRAGKGGRGGVTVPLNSRFKKNGVTRGTEGG